MQFYWTDKNGDEHEAEISYSWRGDFHWWVEQSDVTLPEDDARRRECELAVYERENEVYRHAAEEAYDATH